MEVKVYEVHISLKNGEKFIFFKKAVSKEGVLAELKTVHGQGWYHFVTKSYVKYQVKKEEIVSFGISLNTDEAQEFEDSLKVEEK